jgi:hypothetical protein
MIGNDMPEKYINNLYHGVSRFASEEFDFICFTNEEIDGLHEGIEARPFISPSKLGVLPRLYMYSKDSGLFGNQVLALDIDVIIVGSLKDIMSYRGEFCARSKFKPGFEYLLDGDVISFRAGPENEDRLWNSFVDNREFAERHTKGRERYWYRHQIGDEADRWDEYAPNQIISYKRHMRGRHTLPKGACIVSCHGVPRPHEIFDDWRFKYWS